MVVGECYCILQDVHLPSLRKRREKDWRIGAIIYQLFVDRFAPPDDFEAKKKLYPDAMAPEHSRVQGIAGSMAAHVQFMQLQASFAVGLLARQPVQTGSNLPRLERASEGRTTCGISWILQYQSYRTIFVALQPTPSCPTYSS